MSTKQCPYDPAICCTEPECPVDACKYLQSYIWKLENTIRELKRIGKMTPLKDDFEAIFIRSM